MTNRIPVGGVSVWARVGPEPTLTLGGSGTFGDVVGVASLPDGTIAVADASDRSVRFWSGDGEDLGVERGGVGTLQFQRLTGLGRTPDGFWAFDEGAGRLTIFRGTDIAGTFDAPRPGTVEGRFGDGSFLLRPTWTLAYHRADPREGVRRDTAEWMRWWPESGDTASIGPFPFAEVLVVPTDSSAVFATPPFGRGTSVAVGPGRLWTGDQEHFEIGGHDPDGTLRELVRLEGVDLSITPQQVEQARPGPPEDGAARPDWVDRFWEHVPEQRPAYTRFLLDDVGNLWVAEHVATLDTPRNWLVFDAAGAMRGLVEIPAGFLPLEIARGHMLGLAVEAGVGVVRRYRVTTSDR